MSVDAVAVRLKALAGKGLILEPADGKLRFDVPTGILSPDDWAWPKRNKTEILSRLESSSYTEAAEFKSNNKVDFKSLTEPLPFTGHRRCPVDGCDQWLSFVQGQANCPGCQIEITIIAPGLDAALWGDRKEASA